jgi:hypothetical protein
MADASRFPNLALPFAIVGASAGWLSAGLVNNPLLGARMSQPVTLLCATLLAALAGALLKRLCVGKRYGYEMGDPDPETRPRTDIWILQVGVVIAAGAATGALLAVLGDAFDFLAEASLGGALCAAAFVPVCLAVVNAARRAQRARLGSIVAESDRRAIWGIMTALLAVMTLEALLDWPTWAVHEGPPPLAVPVMLVAAAAATLWIRSADSAALAQAQRVIDAKLSPRKPDEVTLEAGDVPRLDLGLGHDVLARVTRGAAAYRQKERTLALVQGNPETALRELRRGTRRGAGALVLIGAVGALHAAATTGSARALYQEMRCGSWNPGACEMAASLIEARDPLRARALRRIGHPMEGWSAE